MRGLAYEGTTFYCFTGSFSIGVGVAGLAAEMLSERLGRIVHELADRLGNSLAGGLGVVACNDLFFYSD